MFQVCSTARSCCQGRRWAAGRWWSSRRRTRRGWRTNWTARCRRSQGATTNASSTACVRRRSNRCCGPTWRRPPTPVPSVHPSTASSSALATAGSSSRAPSAAAAAPPRPARRLPRSHQVSPKINIFGTFWVSTRYLTRAKKKILAVAII